MDFKKPCRIKWLKPVWQNLIRSRCGIDFLLPFLEGVRGDDRGPALGPWGTPPGTRPQPRHKELTISSFLCSVPVHITPFVNVSGYLSVLLPDWAHMWWRHVLFGVNVHGTYLTAWTYRHQWKCAQGRKEEKVAEREGGAVRRGPETTQSCDRYCFCQLMLWDVKAYDKIKLVSLPKSLNFKKLKKVAHAFKENGPFSS